MFFIRIFFLLVLTTSGVFSKCNTCSSNNVKCISPTQYQYCEFATGALVIDTIFNCTTDTLCNSVGVPVCGNDQECTCGTCTGNLACISDTQFQICQGGLPTAPTISCAAGTKCSSKMIDGIFCIEGGESGCAADVVLTCTAAGRYPIPKTLCKSYYLCSYVNKAWMMYYYNCTGTFNFDPALQKCTSTYSCPIVG